MLEREEARELRRQTQTILKQCLLFVAEDGDAASHLRNPVVFSRFREEISTNIHKVFLGNHIAFTLPSFRLYQLFVRFGLESVHQCIDRAVFTDKHFLEFLIDLITGGRFSDKLCDLLLSVLILRLID